MATQKPVHPIIQAKLQLLEHIRNENYQKIANIAYALSKVAKTNNQIYSKLSAFVQQHKQQLQNMKQQDTQQAEPQIINVDDEFAEGQQWNTDDQVSYQSSQTEQINDNQQIEAISGNNKASQNKGLFKEILNRNVSTQKCSKSKSKSNNSKSKVISNNSKPQSTYQFKQPVGTHAKTNNSNKGITSNENKGLQNKKLGQVHRNSAINKSKPLSKMV